MNGYYALPGYSDQISRQQTGRTVPHDPQWGGPIRLVSQLLPGNEKPRLGPHRWVTSVCVRNLYARNGNIDFSPIGITWPHDDLQRGIYSFGITVNAIARQAITSRIDYQSSEFRLRRSIRSCWRIAVFTGKSSACGFLASDRVIHHRPNSPVSDGGWSHIALWVVRTSQSIQPASPLPLGHPGWAAARANHRSVETGCSRGGVIRVFSGGAGRWRSGCHF